MTVLFITNIPSPYRVAFFNELGKLVKLTVMFEKNAADERNETWKEYEFSTFQGVFLQGVKVSGDKALCPSVIRYLKQKWDHIVVADVSSPTGMLAIQYMKIHHIPYWIEGDGAFAKSGKGMKEHIKRHFICGAKGYFSTSKAHDEYYITYGADPDRIFRYPFTSIHEADVLLDPKGEKEKVRLRAELEMPDRPTVISVGQMIPRKGLDILIRAAAQCKNTNFCIIGGTPTQEYSELKQDLHAENVQFFEFKKPQELKRYYQAADLFVLPTREDIWGLVINEAMANALPIITTDRCVAGLELVRNGENGYIVPVEDVSATVDAIQTALSTDVTKMGARSLDIIREYTIESMAEAHVRILGGQ